MSKLALLVGRGDIAKASLLAVGAVEAYSVEVFSIVEADGSLPFIDIGDPDELITTLRRGKFEHLCVVGSVDLDAERRQSIASFLAQIKNDNSDLSDMGMENALFAIAKEARVKLLGVHELVPSLLAGSGVIAGPDTAFKSSVFDDLVRTARSIARTDIGQSVVFAGKRPIAAEDALGTDSLLERVETIVSLHKIAPQTVTLVKVAKPQQSGVGDLPTIGPVTVENAARAGVRTIVVEASKCLVAERDQVVALANQRKICIFGWG